MEIEASVRLAETLIGSTEERRVGFDANQSIARVVDYDVRSEQLGWALKTYESAGFTKSEAANRATRTRERTRMGKMGVDAERSVVALVGWKLTMLLRRDVYYVWALLALDVGNRILPIRLLFRSKHANSVGVLDHYATHHATDQVDALEQLYIRLGDLFARAIYRNKAHGGMPRVTMAERLPIVMEYTPKVGRSFLCIDE